MTNPDKFIKSGTGSVDVYDKGVFNSYTEIKKYPVKNTSEFEVSSISAQIEVKDSSYKLVGIVPAEFQGKLRPGEDSLLSIRTTTTLQGKGQHFTLSVKSVSAQRPD